MTIDERFWKYVDKTRGCWNWTASKNSAGYGQINRTRKLGPMLAHRFSYELHNGAIPDGLFVLHTCDNPACVNPAHLWLGTDQDNTDDKMAKGRCPAGEGHYNHRLTDNQVVAIRRRWAGGTSQKELSEEYDVTQGYISEIVNNKKRRVYNL